MFLEKGVVQRTSLLTDLTSRSGDNLAILLERHLEYHEPPYVTDGERNLAFQSGTMWSWEFRHESNLLTEGVHLNKWTWQHRQLGLMIWLPIMLRVPSKSLDFKAITIAKNIRLPHQYTSSTFSSPSSSEVDGYGRVRASLHQVRHETKHDLLI